MCGIDGEVLSDPPHIVDMKRRSFTYLINVWNHTQVLFKPSLFQALGYWGRAKASQRKNEGGLYFFSCPCFRSSPTTESLEQARSNHDPKFLTELTGTILLSPTVRPSMFTSVNSFLVPIIMTPVLLSLIHA